MESQKLKEQRTCAKSNYILNIKQRGEYAKDPAESLLEVSSVPYWSYLLVKIVTVLYFIYK